MAARDVNLVAARDVNLERLKSSNPGEVAAALKLLGTLGNDVFSNLTLRTTALVIGGGRRSESPILKALEQNLHDKTVVVNCCYTLSALAYSAAETAAVDAVCRAVAHHSTDPKVARMGCWAVLNLVQALIHLEWYLEWNVKNTTELAESVLRLHNECPKALEKCCDMISIMADRLIAQRASLGNAGCCQLVVEALRNHQSVDTCVISCCKAITSLAKFHPGNRFLLGSAGACPLVVAVMNVRKVESFAVSAVEALVGNDFNKISLGAAGACPALVEVLRRAVSQMKQSKQVALNCALAIGELATIDANRTELIEAGALDLVSNFIGTTESEHHEQLGNDCWYNLTGEQLFS